MVATRRLFWIGILILIALGAWVWFGVPPEIVPIPDTSPKPPVKPPPVNGPPLEVVFSGVRLRRVPVGNFLMGSPESESPLGRDGKYEDRHAVSIPNDFYICVCEITVEQYAALINSGNPPDPSH